MICNSQTSQERDWNDQIDRELRGKVFEVYNRPMTFEERKASYELAWAVGNELMKKLGR